MSELLPCPFCNYTHPVVVEDRYSGDHIVECNRCLAVGPLCETKEEALQYWNKRFNSEQSDP